MDELSPVSPVSLVSPACSYSHMSDIDESIDMIYSHASKAINLRQSHIHMHLPFG